MAWPANSPFSACPEPNFWVELWYHTPILLMNSPGFDLGKTQSFVSTNYFLCSRNGHESLPTVIAGVLAHFLKIIQIFGSKRSVVSVLE